MCRSVPTHWIATWLNLTHSLWQTLKKYLMHMNSCRHHAICTLLHTTGSKILALFVLPGSQLCFTSVIMLIKSEIHNWIGLDSDTHLKQLLMVIFPLECPSFSHPLTHLPRSLSKLTSSEKHSLITLIHCDHYSPPLYIIFFSYAGPSEIFVSSLYTVPYTFECSLCLVNLSKFSIHFL